MKFSLFGFSQPAALDLDLDLRDLSILRWFADFKNSGYMVSREIDGKMFYLVSYTAVAQQLVILNMGRDAVYRRFKKFCDKKILEKRVIYDEAKLVFFAPGENYAKLEDFSFIDEHLKETQENDDDDDDCPPPGDDSFSDNGEDLSDDSSKDISNNNNANSDNDTNSDNSASNFSNDPVDLKPTDINLDSNYVDFKPNSLDLNCNYTDLDMIDGVDFNPNGTVLNQLVPDEKPNLMVLNQLLTVQKPRVTVQKPSLPDEKPNMPVQKPDQSINLLYKSININLLHSSDRQFAHLKDFVLLLKSKLVGSVSLIFDFLRPFMGKCAQNPLIFDSG